jgi:carbon-monoxide dehydrogenase medium subunit
MGTIGGNLCQDTKCLYCGPILPREETSCYRGGGNICYAVTGAKRCQAMAIAETASILICLDAEVSISTPIGQKTTPLEDFFISSGIVDLKEDEILTAIKVPNPPPDTAGIYLRHSMKGALGFALVGVAAVLTVINGVCKDARIGLLGVTRIPIRARKVEQLLKGEKIKDSLIDRAAQVALEETHPLGDTFGSAHYRREIVKVLTKQAINDVSQKLK